MKKLILIGVLFFGIAGAAIVPAHAALDYSGIVKCDGVKAVEYNSLGEVVGVLPGEENRQRECDFAALMDMITSLINWAFMLSIPIFIGLFAYAGILYMTPNPSNRSAANKMLWAALKGFVIMLIAWFLVTTLLKMVLDPLFEDTANSLIEN